MLLPEDRLAAVYELRASERRYLQINGWRPVDHPRPTTDAELWSHPKIGEYLLRRDALELQRGADSEVWAAEERE